MPSDNEQKETTLSLPEFFTGEFFTKEQRNVFEQKEKLSISGVPNISAKLFLLSKFLEQQKNIQNIVLIFEQQNQLHEAISLAPLFLDSKKQKNSFKTLSLQEQEQRDHQKSEWMFALAQKAKEMRNFFFCTKEEALESFPNREEFIKNKTPLQKSQKISATELLQKIIGAGYTLSTDLFLYPGEYRKSGNILDIFPIGFEKPIKIEIGYDSIESMFEFSQKRKQVGAAFEQIDIYPAQAPTKNETLVEQLTKSDMQVWNELEEISEPEQDLLQNSPAGFFEFSSFPEDEETAIHLRYLSVLRFYNLQELLENFREKKREKWKVIVLTKRKEELTAILTEENITFSTDTNEFQKQETRGLLILDAGELEAVPPSFQNQQEKICLLTDREIFHLHSSKKKKITSQNANIDFLTSLRTGDLVVHLDHGIGRFLGICEQEIDGVTREYLEILYLQNDKLYIPVDQADKISRFISEDGKEPKLTRLGGVEWKNIQKRVKRETEKIAKELLAIYAKRAKAKGTQFPSDTPEQQQFEQGFPYEETPGQIAAIRDIKADLESEKPMDRLLCGDVGFGKTEVAMRAAFKVVQSGKQVAFIAPITILAYQHFQSFLKRMEDFDVNVELLSRFRTAAQQKEILKGLKKGTVDIVIGTHRLLSNDVEFHDLGLVIIDEEQRFGVKQKEKFKKIRSEVSILTLSATPIPRTLNLALHKLRDISTITTPPSGRLPIITEVRKYSDRLIRDAILQEKKRNGQIYFLHNRVETIEAMAHKLRQLVPEASFVVGHGQMKAELLEDRILDFKNKKYDVLVSSTIIENGIDLPNANTLIVNNAQDFGLSQLYQLRGRIGRSKTQAYAYLLHSSQKLSVNAKKRLKALIEATELGSGFQLSMRDLEIRGAGDVLGVSQHGTVNVVGVSHFLRLLQQTIKEIEAGRKTEFNKEEPTDVLIEISIDAYIPGKYIADTKEKILMYQKLAGVGTLQKLQELQEEMAEEYGKLPDQVKNLFTVLELKILAKKSRVKAIKSTPTVQKSQEIQLVLADSVTAAEIMNLLRIQPNWLPSGQTLKTDVKNLGFNWTENLKEALKALRPAKKAGNKNTILGENS